MDRAVRDKRALTPLEARVLARLASDLTLAEIGTELGYSWRQVARMSAQIRKKLGAKNPIQAALIAHRLGYISQPDENGNVCAQSPYIE